MFTLQKFIDHRINLFAKKITCYNIRMYIMKRENYDEEGINVCFIISRNIFYVARLCGSRGSRPLWRLFTRLISKIECIETALFTGEGATGAAVRDRTLYDTRSRY